MSVAVTHRGQGVSKLLMGAVVQFAAQGGFRRVVLSTSSMQATAVKAYPRMGFNLVKTAYMPGPWLPLVGVHYFVRDEL
jgi:GNAT superfamily N-acetyltransferase